VALGGGSARGIAHVGVIRWFEEHRIPIDLLAGTSMGGLIGGTFAIGMDSHEIEALLAGIDWDNMFGASTFEFQNVRRKRDRRAYPAGIEFGLKGGFRSAPSLNNGQQVDLLLARVSAPYYGISTFDELPTPFRVVAVDLVTAQPVVIGTGSLARAMRATMSLPAVFPPVEVDGRVLVDGGVLNNIPTDVVRDMGADRVIAVNVGDLDDADEIDYSILGLLGETLDVMMRSNSLKAVAAADIVINVPLEEYSSLDWRRYEDLIAEGYEAAESMREQLLALAVDEATWWRWLDARAALRRTALPAPTTLTIGGAGSSDERVMRRAIQSELGEPLDVVALESDIVELGGLDRYETLTWSLAPEEQGTELRVDAVAKKYGPPFLFLGLSLENTTAREFRFSLSGRYLAFDVLGSGTELRLDAAVGSEPTVSASWYRPIGSSAVFFEPRAEATSRTLAEVDDDKVVATYREVRSRVGADLGVNLGRLDEIRLGFRTGRLDADVRVGNPNLPEVSGAETLADLRWTHDGQDSPVVPSEGLLARAAVRYYLDAPEPRDVVTTRRTKHVTQAELRVFWVQTTGASRRGRVFAMGGLGTSFDGEPLPTEQFNMGGPFLLGAFNQGDQRGDHFMLATGGYLHEIFRMPDFLGGPVFVGGWLETGKAFDQWDDVDYVVHGSGGIIADTLVGPLFLSFSAGSGNFRTYVGIGRVFR
jgi:NTE family protein